MSSEYEYHGSTIKQVARPALDLHRATISIATTLRILVIALAALTLALGCVWFLLRSRARTRHRRNLSTELIIFGSDPASDLMIYESDISISMIEEGLGIDFDSDDCETILSSASPRRIAFDDDKLPLMMAARKGSILDRRGRNRIACDTSAYYNIDAVLTGTATGPLSGKLLICQPVTGFKELKTPSTTVWSKMPESAT